MTARPVAVSAGLRLLRGVLLAVTAAALSVAAHGAAGGGMPDTGLTMLGCLALGWVGTAVSDRRHSPTTIIAALGASQLALHLILSMPDALSAHHHHHSPVAASALNGQVMLGAHTLAAILTGLLLATADTALLAMATAVSAVLPCRSLPLPARAPLPVSTATARVDATLDLLLSRICARRGPPATA